MPFDFHIISRGQTRVDFDVFQRGASSSSRREPVQLDKARAVLQGADLDFGNYVQDWTIKTCDERLLTFPSATLSAGVYELEARSEREFEEGELMLNEMHISNVKLQVRFSVQVIRPPVISHYEIATRGRVLTLAPADLGGKPIQFGFVFS